MKVHALILGNIAPLSGCEFKSSRDDRDISEFALFTKITTRL